MGLIDRFRRRFTVASSARLDVGMSEHHIDSLRRALLAESRRLERPTGLSLTVLLEHTDLDVRRIDIYEILGYLQAQGEIENVEQDSMGNLRWDLSDRLRQPPE